MLFNKGTRLFTLLSTSGIAIGVTIGMIVFHGNQKPLVNQEDQVLDNIELELKKFENEELSEQEQSDNPNKNEDTGSEGKSADDKQDLNKDKELPKEKDPSGNKGKEEKATEINADQGAKVHLGPEQSNQDPNSLLMPNIPSGKEKLDMKAGEERKVILGQGVSDSQPKSESSEKTHSEGQHTHGEDCPDCPKKEQKHLEDGGLISSFPEEAKSKEKINAEAREEGSEETGRPQKPELEPEGPPEDADTESQKGRIDEQQEPESITQKDLSEERNKLVADEEEHTDQAEPLDGLANQSIESGPSDEHSDRELTTKEGSQRMEGQDAELTEGENGKGSEGSSEEATSDSGSAIVEQLATLLGLRGELNTAIGNLRTKVSS